MVRSTAASRCRLLMVWLGWLLMPAARGDEWPEHRVGPGHRGGGQATRPALSDRVRYREAVRSCLDNLLAHGTDRYGPVATPMLMSIIDVRSNEAPREPLPLDACVRTEERPGRRNPGGCDLWDDQPLLHALYAFGERAHDPRYARAADAYVRSFFERAPKPNGMLGRGTEARSGTGGVILNDRPTARWLVVSYAT